MDLQISVFLLFILFTAGHSLRCYRCMGEKGSCANQTIMTCPIGFSQCFSSTTITQIDGIRSTPKLKACVPDCPSGSINFGNTKMTHYCCNTDLCNFQDAPVPSLDPSSTKDLNGKKCFYCDGKNCSNIVSCSGIEDRCVQSTVTFNGQTLLQKGCISKSICDAADTIHDPEVLRCCEGNLCNGAQSDIQSSTVNSAPSVSQSSTVTSALSVSQSSTVTSAPSVSQSSTVTSAPSVSQSSTVNSAPSVSQSFLFLCCSLLSYFLLH